MAVHFARGRPLENLGVPDNPRVAKMLGAIWALLVFNTLGTNGALLLPIPRPVAQMLTMGAVGVAFVLALVINPRLKFRPGAYLLLLSVLLIGSIASSIRMESGTGSLFRCARFGCFIATLWLISPWMDGTMRFVRQHIRVLLVLLVTVAVGLVIAPGRALPALNDGRLTGVLWPLTPPQVGQYAAIVAGLALLLWLSKLTDGRSALVVTVPSIGLLLLTHTRTATLGLLVGLLVAGLSMMLTNARARKVFGWGVVIAGLIAVVAGPLLQTWFLRGQDAQNFTNLTGRAKVWHNLLETPRTWFENLFGTGLSNKSFDGLPIDNSWYAVFHEQGFLGVVIVALFLITLLLVAISRAPSPARACAIFLIVYCMTASWTEAGLGDASPYLLNLAIAAGLLSTNAANRVEYPQRTSSI